MTPEDVMARAHAQAVANQAWCELGVHDWSGGWRDDIGSCAICWSCGSAVPVPPGTRLPGNLNELSLTQGVASRCRPA